MGQSWLAWIRARFARAPLPLGARGEAAAARYLKQRGYKIVATQVRTTLGEIDLVAVDGKTIVFVEVRARNDTEHGHPFETISPDKERRLTRLALAYLKRHRLLEYPARFDVVGVVWPCGSDQPQIEHIIAAFPATGFAGMFS